MKQSCASSSSSSSIVLASTKLVRSLSSDIYFPVTTYRNCYNDGDDRKTEQKVPPMRYKAVVGDRVCEYCCSYDRTGFTLAKQWLLHVCTTGLSGIIYKQSEESKGFWYTHLEVEFSTAPLQLYQLINAKKSELAPTPPIKQKILKYNPTTFPAFKGINVTLFAKMIQSKRICGDCYENTAYYHLEMDDSPWDLLLCANCMHARCWQCELCSTALWQSELQMHGEYCSTHTTDASFVDTSLANASFMADAVASAAVSDANMHTLAIAGCRALPFLNCKTIQCVDKQCTRRASFSLWLANRVEEFALCKTCLYKSIIRCSSCNAVVKYIDLPEYLVHLSPLCANCLSSTAAATPSASLRVASTEIV